MSTSVATQVTNGYLASGIHDWLSNFGSIYYHPDADTDSNNIQKTYTKTNGNYEPEAIIDFDSGELVALTAIEGTDWEAANEHLRRVWQTHGDVMVEPMSFDLPRGEAYIDGYLAVSPYSVLGALFNSDTLESEHFPGTDSYCAARPLTMLYKEQAVEWVRTAQKQLIKEGNDGGGIGIDFMGVLVAQTTGKTDVPVGLLSEVDGDKPSFATTIPQSWTSATQQFID